jgi:CRISPR type III-B/RAMP module RAMP protein Cmr1
MSVSETLHLTVDTVTPLVIAGYDATDQNLTKEGLRPPSVRGALRWWFRAMIACIIDGPDRWERLRTLESTVFGSTGEQSSVMVRAVVASASSIKVYVRMNDPESFTLPNGRTVQSPKRAALRAGSSFHLQLNLHNPRTSPVVLGSLWLLAMLSGVGARTRRGFGSLLIEPQDEVTAKAIKNLELPLQLVGDANNDGKALAAGITRVRDLFAEYAGASLSGPRPQHFPSLCRGQCKCWLITKDDKNWPKWENCMDDLRDDIYRGFKSKLDRSDLGNPSPLHVQVKRFPGGDHYGVLTAFQKDEIFGRGWAELDGFLKSLHDYRCVDVVLP